MGYKYEEMWVSQEKKNIILDFSLHTQILPYLYLLFSSNISYILKFFMKANLIGKYIVQNLS